MKKILFFISLFLIFTNNIFSQEKKFELYDVSADPTKQIADAQIQANKENKNILVQVGGNWCVWCKYFYKFSSENKKIDSAINKDFVVVHVNYSKENKNESFLKKYKNPNRFGFPVFVILNNNGELLHIQDSGYLEEGKGYSEEKVLRFLSLWNPYSTLLTK